MSKDTKIRWGWMKGIYVVIIALTVVLSSGVVYSQDKPGEIIAEGIVPEEWGTLRGVIAIPLSQDARLFFEDSDGTVRTVVLFPGKEKPRLFLEGGAIVIRRNK